MQFIVFILILSVLIMIHEAGHYLMAKYFKMRVEEFGIGLPPRAKKLFTRDGTLFSLNWLPLGGFVRLYGEDFEDETQVRNPEAFFNKPAWQRAIVLTAGVTMNFLLGVVLFGAVYSYLGIPTKTDSVIIVGVSKDSPAELAGLTIDSKVKSLSFGGEVIPFKNMEEFIKGVDGFRGNPITVEIEREGVVEQKTVTPRENPPVGEGALGVTLSNVEMVKFPWYEMPFRGMVVGLKEAWAWGLEIFGNLKMVFVQIFTGKGLPKDISGPIGIYEVSKEVYKVGVIALLQFMAILSINLAILNIMPFPALDGGRIFFLLIEKVVGKKLKNKAEGYVHTAGMVFLLGLMLMITIKDVIRLVAK